MHIGEDFAGKLVGLADQGDGRTLDMCCGRDLGMVDATFCLLRVAAPRARLRCAIEPGKVGEE